MPSFRTHRVTELSSERTGLQRVLLDDGSRAYVLTQLTGTVAVGDQVVVNTTAVELGLGTGGWHVVHWNLSRGSLDLPGPDHIMKLRYTSLQVDTGAAETTFDDFEPGGVHGPEPSVNGIPVLVGGLHSQMGVAAVVAKALRPELRISYVMTDGAALPLALSDLVAALRDSGHLDGTVTTGHAFGGDLEAVSLPSGLHLAATRQGADLIICTMGPGVVGTRSALGTTALETASTVMFVDQLGGRPEFIVRASSADPRRRHRAISHHSIRALSMTPVPLEIALPEGKGLTGLIPAPHVPVEVEVPDTGALLRAAGITVTTMGRGPDDDPLFFDVVAAAVVRATGRTTGGDTVQPA